MDFKCTHCSIPFPEMTKMISHLRKVHKVIERTDRIDCLVNFKDKSVCTKSYLTFSGLRTHMQQCLVLKHNEDRMIPETPFDQTNETNITTQTLYDFEQLSLNVSIEAPIFEIEKFSYSFEHQLAINGETSSENIGSDENDFLYINQNKKATNEAAEKMTHILNSFISSITNLKIPEQGMNHILKSSISLVENLNAFNLNLIEGENGFTIAQALQTTTQYVRNAISAVSSKYKRKKYVNSCKINVPTKKLAIGTRWETRKMKVDGRFVKIPRLIQSVFQYISILGTLSAVFSHQDFANQYIEFNMYRMRDHTCAPGQYTSFCCGSTYKSVELFQNHPDSIQLQLSSDDFEPCNPLASKSNRHKICAVYLSIQNLPVKYLSKCKFVFLVALCNSDDIKMKHTDFNNIWFPVVNEIKELETKGISVPGYGQVKGTLASLAFDNLGAHYALGYVKSFSSNHYCRFCICSRDICQCSIEENASKLRTIENYEEHLEIVDQSTKVNFTETKGVEFYCLLSDLKYFHIISNPTVDIMHDINEGAVPFVLKLLFNQIKSSKLMNESELSMSIQLFDYGFLDRRNSPSSIELEKKSLGQNASQSLCLIRHIPFILWRYRVHPDLQEIWKCVGALLRIIEIVYARELTEENVTQLKTDLEIFLSQVIKIAGRLIPKMHFMLHYPRIIKMMGPIVFMNMLRFERKHLELKKHITKNFKNINLTIANKHQELICTNGISYRDDVQTGKSKPAVNHPFENILIATFGTNLSDINELQSLKLNNYEYRANVLVIHNSKLYQIKNIFSCFDNFHLIVNSFAVVSFDHFLNSFEIEEITSTDHELIEIKSLKNAQSYEILYKDHKKYIKAETLDMRLNKYVY